MLPQPFKSFVLLAAATLSLPASLHSALANTPVASPKTFSGRVLMAGKPAAYARVAVAGDNWIEPALTDASGGFRFENLPPGEVEFLAAGASEFGSLQTRVDATDVVVKLEAASFVDTGALSSELIKQQPGRGDWRLGWPVFGAEMMETIALRGDNALDAGGQPMVASAGRNLSIYFADLARYDAARLVARGPQLLPFFRSGAAKNQAEMTLARVQAASSEADAQKAAQTWLGREARARRSVNLENVTQLLVMADIAARLKRPDAPAILDLALTFASQLPAKVRLDNAEDWGSKVARINPEALELLLQDLDVAAQFRAISGAIRTLARSGDLENAQLYLKKMEELQSAPEIEIAERAAAEANGQRFDMQLSATQLEIARALAPTNAAGALEIAERLSGHIDIVQQLNTLLEIGMIAHQNGKSEVAASAVRTAADAENLSDYSARAGAIAMSFDPVLGTELFKKALIQVAPSESNRRFRPSVATWALENAPFDPALSRVVLEREWSWRLPAYLDAAAKNEGDGEAGYHENHLGYLAWAMSVLDPNRALQWVGEIPEKAYVHGQAKALIAATLIAKPAQRVNFNRYLNWENPDY